MEKRTGLKPKTFKCGHTEMIGLLDFMVQKDGRIIDIYTDERGRRRRVMAKCYDCYMAGVRAKRGTKPRLESQKPNIVSAIRAEKAAAKFFEEKGFHVQHGHGAGPDLIIDNGVDEPQTVEVKQPFKCTRCWQVPRVRESRRYDDLIAIVMPNGFVHVEDMAEYMKGCNRYGSKNVTALVREIGLAC